MRGRGGLGGSAAKRMFDTGVSSFFDAELASNIVQERLTHKKSVSSPASMKKEEQQRQPLFDAYVVLDFEATCERNRRIPDPEIIEFPMIIIDARTASIFTEFQRYVRPVVHPVLSTFCTELTGITQAVVDQAVPFPFVLNEALQFLRQGGFGDAAPWRSFLFVTCGDWDLQTMLPSQLALSNAAPSSHLLSVPPTFQRWCNLKKMMRNVVGHKKRINDMPDILKELGLSMTGRHHSGIDDCRNIAAAVQRLLRDGHAIGPTVDNSGLPQWLGAPWSGDSPQESSLVSAAQQLNEGSLPSSLPPGHVKAEVKSSVTFPAKRLHVNIIQSGTDPVDVLLRDVNVASLEMPRGRMVRYSKDLARILRHDAEKMGLPISSGGYVRVEDLLRLKPFDKDPEALIHMALVVRNNEKQRFHMAYDELGQLYIRANQGHSLEGIDPCLRRITKRDEAPEVIHGTYHEAWKTIRQCGYLSAMSRIHIHFSKGLPKSKGVISGMRGNAEVLLYLNVAKVLADGVELLESANGVLLTSGVGGTKHLPLEYILKAVDRQTGEELPFTTVPQRGTAC